MNGAEAIADILKREGTEFLACYPRQPLIEASAKVGIRPVLCRQERMGIAIADGFSRTTTVSASVCSVCNRDRAQRIRFLVWRKPIPTMCRFC